VVPQTVPLLYSCPIISIIIIIIIIDIIVGLGSTNEWEHVIFGLLSLTYLIQHEGLLFLFCWDLCFEIPLISYSFPSYKLLCVISYEKTWIFPFLVSYLLYS
jgi:hypothetical protein